MNELYSKMCKAYSDSYEETIKFQKSLNPSSENKNLSHDHMS